MLHTHAAGIIYTVHATHTCCRHHIHCACYTHMLQASYTKCSRVPWRYSPANYPPLVRLVMWSHVICHVMGCRVVHLKSWRCYWQLMSTKRLCQPHLSCIWPLIFPTFLCSLWASLHPHTHTWHTPPTLDTHHTPTLDTHHTPTLHTPHTPPTHTHTHTQDELERNIIPQIPLFDLLSKFDGCKEKVLSYNNNGVYWTLTFDLSRNIRHTVNHLSSVMSWQNYHLISFYTSR